MSDSMKSGPVYVSVPSQVFHNFDKMHSVTKEVLGRLGCPGCHSGFDIRFQQEVEFHATVEGKLR